MKLTSNILGIAASAILLATSQSAFAAYSFALAEYTGIDAIRTTGTATATVISETPFFALGETSEGVADVLDDGVTFSSETSSFGEGTAFNSGVAGASLAEASDNNDAIATTLADIELEIDGDGSVEIDFGFSLLADAFDNDTSAFAVAMVEIAGGLEGLVVADIMISDAEVTGIGSLETLSGVLTLTFESFGFGPVSEFIGVTTLAEVNATVVPVPAAVWLMGSALVGLIGYRRK